MKSITCGSCYSDQDIIYIQQTFVCKSCKVPIVRCDICGLYCHNMCLTMFDQMLKLD